jgi:FkbM family methyltransferase
MANRALYRHGTSDAAIWKNVVELNEYRLPDQFEPKSLVLDIGGNTGAFTYACIQRGAAKVIAFEPDPDNFHIFRKQLKAEIADGRVEVYPLAVVGGSGFSWRTFSGVVQKDGEINHGGAFLFSEEYGDYGLGKYMVGKPSIVPCIGWDQVVERCSDAGFDRVHLLKLDCEGSEWSILRYSELFGVEKIAGEYHPFDTDNRDSLEALLSLHFKKWEIIQHPNSELGLFFATR